MIRRGMAAGVLSRRERIIESNNDFGVIWRTICGLEDSSGGGRAKAKGQSGSMYGLSLNSNQHYNFEP